MNGSKWLKWTPYVGRKEFEEAQLKALEDQQSILGRIDNLEARRSGADIDFQFQVLEDQQVILRRLDRLEVSENVAFGSRELMRGRIKRLQKRCRELEK